MWLTLSLDGVKSHQKDYKKVPDLLSAPGRKGLVHATERSPFSVPLAQSRDHRIRGQIYFMVALRSIHKSKICSLIFLSLVNTRDLLVVELCASLTGTC